MDTEALTVAYARVKAILDEAAGDSTADYGGAGRFWDNGARALEGAEIFGIKMVAPVPAGHACCVPPHARSDASGLIKGLRGEAPFDGGRFPALPWGGHAVAPADIDRIADWIDGGCPDDATSVAVELAPGKPAKTATVKVSEIAEFAVAADGYSPAAGVGEPRRRMNIDCMSEPQLERLRRGFRQLYSLNRWPEDRRSYNNQALIHQNHCQHGWERFLPWHRAYLYEFEQNLQDFEPGLMLPYWDFTMPEYRPDEPDKGRIIPTSMKAYLTEEAAETLVAALDPAPTAAQKKAILALARDRMYFTSQHAFFCYLISTIGYSSITPDPKDANRQRFIDALLQSNSLWYPLRYPAEYAGGGTINQVINYHYPSADDIAQILSLNNFRDFGGGSIYDAAFGFLDQNPHNTMHIWTGGQNPDAGQATYVCKDGPTATGTTPQPGAETERVRALATRRNDAAQVGGRRFHARSDLYSQPGLGDMFSNLTASYDPVFWPIHVNIDRIWWEWQKLNPNALPADLDSVLSPWNYTIRDTLDIAPFGYEYVRSSHFMPVGLEAPVSRFVSQPITVPQAARSFKRAEIRLHQVPQLTRSCFVRAFLNEPGADASTPIKGNPHYAGYISIFGHGACYGGPGHCDIPPPQPRRFDQRGRSHNTPRVHRIDVTAAARQALKKKGPLQITLVVIGGDYREERELLKLEGVSISFLD
ncbi:tyrosinase family protein [Bradyrhizobium sp. SSUT18]|uniref:tyrosinase family protein n=1 Tax=Bradyrhizobium sp. SSUT18 TaxID=3040602 RepID=UPI00244CAFB8|nr:tyrosinase family protein [Bradyrhizobium sp. SSUT18]MDH2406373.1 tyrosinase family protein [Bradyrhizobium sp. SSUT18]